MRTGNSTTTCRFALGLLLRTGAIALRTTVRLERVHLLNSNYVNSEKKFKGDAKIMHFLLVSPIDAHVLRVRMCVGSDLDS